MGTYILRRLVHSIIVLFGITFFVFLLLHLSGDPVRLLLPFDATDEQYRAMKQAMGFNDPFFVQYFRFLEKAVRLDFGMSLRNQVPVFGLISGYFKNTLLLATAAFTIALFVAVPAGILSAIKMFSSACPPPPEACRSIELNSGIRETARKFQHSISQLTLWQRFLRS